MHEIFAEAMCFEVRELGESWLYNDKGDLDLMPKARYALLKDPGTEKCGESNHKEEL